MVINMKISEGDRQAPRSHYERRAYAASRLLEALLKVVVDVKSSNGRRDDSPPVADSPDNDCTPCLSGRCAAQALRSIPDRFGFSHCKAMKSNLREKFDTRPGF